MSLPEIVNQDQWETARRELLAREKELTHARTRSPPPAGACRWCRWTRTTASRGPAARWA